MARTRETARRRRPTPPPYHVDPVAWSRLPSGTTSMANVPAWNWVGSGQRDWGETLPDDLWVAISDFLHERALITLNKTSKAMKNSLYAVVRRAHAWSIFVESGMLCNLLGVRLLQVTTHWYGTRALRSWRLRGWRSRVPSFPLGHTNFEADMAARYG
jgi:hypothetical protein